LQLDRDFEGHEMWPEPTMMRLLEITTKAADLRLSRAARRLEAILLREFPSQVASKAGDWALETEAVAHQSPHFSIVGTGAESAGFVGVSAQSGLEHRGGQGG